MLMTNNSYALRLYHHIITITPLEVVEKNNLIFVSSVFLNYKEMLGSEPKSKKKI